MKRNFRVLSVLTFVFFSAFSRYLIAVDDYEKDKKAICKTLAQVYKDYVTAREGAESYSNAVFSNLSPDPHKYIEFINRKAAPLTIELREQKLLSGHYHLAMMAEFNSQEKWCSISATIRQEIPNGMHWIYDASGHCIVKINGIPVMIESNKVEKQGEKENALFSASEIEDGESSWCYKSADGVGFFGTNKISFTTAEPLKQQLISISQDRNREFFKKMNDLNNICGKCCNGMMVRGVFINKNALFSKLSNLKDGFYVGNVYEKREAVSEFELMEESKADKWIRDNDLNKLKNVWVSVESDVNFVAECDCMTVSESKFNCSFDALKINPLIGKLVHDWLVSNPKRIGIVVTVRGKDRPFIFQKKYYTDFFKLGELVKSKRICRNLEPLVYFIQNLNEDNEMYRIFNKDGCISGCNLGLEPWMMSGDYCQLIKKHGDNLKRLGNKPSGKSYRDWFLIPFFPCTGQNFE
ncbi:hypothetical protein CI610_01033 [invertebrate metagenome]|uniref:Uncharacterized protein n=1 Tax=invertebrate metagenome TaxID=1711999 RepID=A0A2H9T9N6_9ZZZZ